MTSRRFSQLAARACLTVAAFVGVSASVPAHAGRETISIDVTTPQPATITADLYTPSGAGPYPVVMLLHGCGGVTPNIPAWAQWLQSEGYAALAVHSFPGRGLRNVCADSSPLFPAMRAADVFAAAAKVQAMGIVDRDRLALIGFSHGGSTALAAWRTQPQHPNVTLRAIVAFYPGCRHRRPANVGTPLLILIGDKDDWTPAEGCRQLAEAARQASRPVTLIVYPDAAHHFDGAHLKKRTYVSIARGGQGATIEYSPAAHADAEKQVKQFLATTMKP
jgi:dienelactone hydrolase